MTLARTVGRLLLGVFLLLAGTAHLTFARETFAAQVPGWLPLSTDLVVLASGVVEIALGAALLLLPRHRGPLGALVALFLVAVFPGNVAQWWEGRDAFGLDTDRARLTRLFFQPLLVWWALWAGDTVRWWRARRRTGRQADGPAGAGGGAVSR